MGTIGRLCMSSGMEFSIREYMKDCGIFDQADREFDRGDYSSTAYILKRGLYDACQMHNGDYDFNYNKIKIAVGNLIGPRNF